MLDRLAAAFDLDAGARERPRNVAMRHHDRPAAVADDATVEPVQRVGDHRRRQHLLDGHDIAQHRVRIVLRMVRRRDLDPGQLLAGGAVLIHVPHGAHGVEIHRGRAERELERHVRRVGIVDARRGPGRHALRARPAGQRDQRDAALAGGDGGGGMRHMDQIGRAAGVGGIHVPDVEADIVEHRQGTEPGGIAGTEIAVDIAQREPGVGQRPARDLGVQLPERLVERLAGRMLVGTDDIGRSAVAHAGTRSLGGDAAPC